jgi:hypothetical protein
MATNQRLFDALRVHDGAALSALYAPDAFVTVGPGLADAHGATGAAGLAATLWAALPDAKVQWGTLLQSDTIMVVEFAWTGTHMGALGSAPPTKRAVGGWAVAVLEFTSDGLIKAERVYLDGVAADLTARPAKPHSFSGLPTRQTTVRLSDARSPANDRVMEGLVGGAADDFHAALALADASTTVSDRATGRTSTGKGALASWPTRPAHSFGNVTAREVGDWVVIERRGSADVTTEDPWSGRVDLIRFDDGHIADVRSYRNLRRQ